LSMANERSTVWTDLHEQKATSIQLHCFSVNSLLFVCSFSALNSFNCYGQVFIAFRSMFTWPV
jgi:hypothetical protein